MTQRRYISKAVRREVASRQAGCDPDTGFVLLGTAELDHFVPLALGGSNDPDNLIWRNKAQHRVKTAIDIRAIRKADRCRKKFGCRAKPWSADTPKAVCRDEAGVGGAGAPQPRHKFKRKIQSRGFDKRLRKRMDGTVEARG